MTAPASDTGLYVHIPFCQRKCPYCGFYSVPLAAHSPDRFVEAVLKEIDMYYLTAPPATLYIGGGSPTCLPAKLLMRLLRGLQQRFGPVDEWTVECNPAQVTAHLFDEFLSAGVNRLSIGVQSFDASELVMLERLHCPEDSIAAVQAAQRCGFDNIGLDLIFGLPDSGPLAWQSTLDRTVDLNVQHVSAYSLTLEPDTPFERAARQGMLTLIDESTERTMYEMTRIQLARSGFVQYEISNFARPGLECRHNIRYWKNRPVIGIGPAAGGWYHQQRTSNIPDVDRYMEMIEAGRLARLDARKPSPEQMASETAILNLRMCEGIDRDAFRRRTGFDVDELFGPEIDKHCRLGLLERSDTRIRLTDRGLSFADTVAADFIR